MAVPASSVKGMLVRRQTDVLTKALIDDIAVDDPTRAGVVMAGHNYEGEAETDRIIVQVMDVEPRRPEGWHMGRASGRDDLGFEYPQFEGLIGGPMFMTERGAVKITVNLSGNGTTIPAMSEDDGIQIRQTVMARAVSALQTSTELAGFFDDFGAACHVFKVSQLPEYPLAGPNFEGLIRWAALVTVPRR